MALFEEILGWLFPLRSWRTQQGMAGGEDSADSTVWQENFDRFGLRLFDTARADLRCTEVIQGEGALHLRYEVR